MSRTTVLAAAHIKARYQISYADTFAVVTAQDYDGALVTGDPEFRAIERDNLLEIDWLAQK